MSFGLLPKALDGGQQVTRQTAWTVLEDALQAGLWYTAPRDRKPDWAPGKRHKTQ